MTHPALLNHSHQWDMSDLWPSDAFWNVPGNPAAGDVAVAVIVVGLVVFAIRTRKGMK